MVQMHLGRFAGPVESGERLSEHASQAGRRRLTAGADYCQQVSDNICYNLRVWGPIGCAPVVSMHASRDLA